MAADFTLDREDHKEGGGYVTFTAKAPGTDIVLAKGAYWPRNKSGYLWTAAALQAERDGTAAALAKQSHYRLEEADMRTLVREEAQKAANPC